MLALVPASEAKIIYTPAHRILKVGMNYKLDLNHDGVVDFILKNYRCKSCGGGADLSVLPAAGNGASGFATTSGTWASALKPGALIGTRRYFPGKGMAFVGTTRDGATINGGSWVNVKNRYLGLKFKIEGKTHYGWARLNVSVQNLSVIATLTGYAYETVPDKPIFTGQTKEPEIDNAVDQSTVSPIALSSKPATLGLLAMGAPGLSIWRREDLVPTRSQAI
jgi:hypothetical protein